MPPPTRFTPVHAPSALPMRSADGTGAIPTILIGTLVCPTIGAGDPVPAGARAANIIMEQAPVAESLRLPLATQGGEPWALKKNPHALALESHGSEIAVIIRDFLARVT